MSRSDEELIRDALDHIDMLNAHLTQGSLDNPLIADAVNMRLSAAIESLSQTSPEFREEYFAGESKLMWATRNRISHGYSYVEPSLIKLTIMNRLPALEERLRSALNRFGT